MRKIANLAIGLAAFAFVTVATGTHTVNAQSAESNASAKPAPVMVTVAEGDTLSAIADKHSTTYIRIFNANESIANPDVINPGQQVRIPTAEEQLAERALPEPVVVAAPAATTVSYRAAAPQQAVTRTAPAAAAPVSSNDAKAFIYAKESGNNPNATNPSGCYGIGQDCNGVVRNMCGADYACQDAYFTSYMSRRYGSWEAARAFWLQNNWW